MEVAFVVYLARRSQLSSGVRRAVAVLLRRREPLPAWRLEESRGIWRQLAGRRAGGAGGCAVGGVHR